ncbi:hypothetical protein AVEN_124830-1 [Araneus ventricosus]|uniref:Uncharacterized protein n=1 Tax=Araneus ventricosus TaxID=182803 RepID=A0A4Y2X550_ARAVE|nr:hypothetical protein AVEN_204078-1 [Araneus ventricosus]GBO44845.1 hypothetical protein AVEN_124830-1 [Araneus ventricosus]
MSQRRRRRFQIRNLITPKNYRVEHISHGELSFSILVSTTTMPLRKKFVSRDALRQPVRQDSVIIGAKYVTVKVTPDWFEFPLLTNFRPHRAHFEAG